MGLRSIKYVGTDGQSSKTVYSQVATWGELKREFPEIDALSKGKTAQTKGTEHNPGGVTLTQDYSVLPEGDIVLYFLISKNDSGKG